MIWSGPTVCTWALQTQPLRGPCAACDPGSWPDCEIKQQQYLEATCYQPRTPMTLWLSTESSEIEQRTSGTSEARYYRYYISTFDLACHCSIKTVYEAPYLATNLSVLYVCEYKTGSLSMIKTQHCPQKLFKGKNALLLALVNMASFLRFFSYVVVLVWGTCHGRCTLGGICSPSLTQE